MKKYLEDLRKELKNKSLDDFSIQDIINDLETMINEAMEEGLSEEDIPKKFGDPKDLAENLANDESNEEDESKEDQVGNLTFDIDNIKGIDIKLMSEDIYIEASDNQSIQVVAENANLKDYNIQEKEGCLYLERKHKPGNIIFRVMRPSGQTFKIYLPKEKELKDIQIKTKNSDGAFSNISADNFDLKTMNGDYKFNHVKANKLFIKSLSGDFDLQNLKTQEFVISNVSGDFDIAGSVIEKELNISTVSGDFDIDDTECGGLHYQSVSGDLDAKEFYPESITMKSVSGDIKFKNKDKNKDIKILKKQSISGDIEI